MLAPKHICMTAAFALALTACSSSSKKYFETEGLRAPISACLQDPSGLGQMARMSDISEGNGCEVDNRYDVQSLGRVSFTQPATMNCGMIAPLHGWLEQTVQKSAREHLGEDVVGINVAASYACRPRNNRRGAKMSEHGYGNAIDISGFTLASGRQISVKDDYYSRGNAGDFLKQVRSEACGEFSTVLGPGSDSAHRDHLHLDLQNRRSGKSFCR